MKTLVIGMFLFFSFHSSAYIIEAIVACDARRAVNDEQTLYDGAKEEYKAQGLNIDKMEPNRARKIKILKAKFQKEKKKFEKEHKVKFDPEMC